MGRRWCLFAGAATLWHLGAADRTCQLLTDDDTSLQHNLGITCNVSDDTCQCTWSLWESAGWVPLDVLNGTAWNATAPAGEWYVRDLSGRCVATLDKHVLVPEPQPCPPGFYCEGGLEPPRACSGGEHCPARTNQSGQKCPPRFFCPIPGAPLQPCPKGGFCPEGSQYPQPCEAGFFCQAGLEEVCPEDHYCPFGTTHPRRCNALTLCPEGSKSENVVLYAAAFLVACTLGALVGARYYHRIVRHGFYVCAVCLALVGVTWAVDAVIAGFLSLAFVVAASNWILVQINTCLSFVSKFLMLTSLAAALWALWLVNPPWSMFASGLVVASLIMWLMSRQTFALVVLGRLALILAVVALMVGYFLVDWKFSAVVCGLFVLDLWALFVSWAWQRWQRRPKQRPFRADRWQSESARAWPSGPSSTTVASSGAGAAPAGEASEGAAADAGSWEAFNSMIPLGCGGSPRAKPPSERSASLLAEARARATFNLESVSFSLPGGERLLKEISLTIGPKRRVAVMGASGSGKSTLLAVLSGRASYGRIEGQFLVAGQPARDLRFLKRVTGFVPQDDILHGELSVRENIRFQAALRLPAGTAFREIEAHVVRVAANLGLDAIMDARVGTPEQRGVSGGQRKRVSIAMELVAEPLLLFADEPTSGLDSTTSDEVIACLNNAALDLGTTVIAVIHQPRYATLCRFDDLLLLGGGQLVYAGPTEDAITYFTYALHTVFPPNTNPADVMLDRMQKASVMLDDFAKTWSENGQPPCALEDNPLSDPRRTHRIGLPFFRAMLIYMDRSMLQSLRACTALFINQALTILAVVIFCHILQYSRFDQFLMQSAFATLFLMLLQGVAAQRIFGADLLVTWREAHVGMPMIAYFVAKDLAALFEVTLSSAVFTATYGWLSGAQMELYKLFAGAWPFVFAVFGMAYMFSIILSPGAAQMAAVVSAFLSFCVAGAYQPQLPELAASLDGRGWMVPAMSPVRWFWGYLITQESQQLTAISRLGAWDTLLYKGYDLAHLHDVCVPPRSSGPFFGTGVVPHDLTLQQAWMEKRGWVCSGAPLLLLGLLFRFLACMCLLMRVHAHTSGWALFFAQSEVGAWKLVGHLFKVLVAIFMGLFVFAEVWIFGVLKLDWWGLL